MSSSLEAAFNFLCGKKFIAATLTRNGTTTIDVQLTSSNYSRKESGPEDTVVYGNEYLIPAKFFTGTAISAPKRGDILNEGTFIKSEAIGFIEPLFNLGESNIFGWRVRTE